MGFRSRAPELDFNSNFKDLNSIPQLSPLRTLTKFKRQSLNREKIPLTLATIMAPRKSRAKPKEVIEDSGPTLTPMSKPKRAPEIQWAKNPSWTYTLIEYLGDHVGFRLKLFSDSTADATRENRPKLTAKDSKSQQYTVLARHIFAGEPGQSSLFLQNPGRYATAVETRLRR